MRPTWLRVLPVALSLLVHVGCSSDKPPARPLPNLRPTGVSVLTANQDVQVSHRLDVQVGIFSDTALQGVGVAFRLFPRAQYDAHDENIESWVLGSTAYDIPAGDKTFDAELQVPYDVPAGEYYVVPDVDPLDTIAESDETDQYGAKAPLVVRDDHKDQPRLMIHEATLDGPSFELSWATGVPPGPLGLTLLVGAEANPDAPVSNSEITACVRGPKTGWTGCSPLGIWDSAGAHAPKLVVPELLPGDPTSVHVDLSFGPDLAAAFDALVDGVATACLADVDACVEPYGAQPACVRDCVAPAVGNPAADPVALRACLLKCLPFTIEATIGKPDVVLYEPAGATPGRTATANLQLLAPRPVSPVVPPPLEIKPLADPVIGMSCEQSFCICDPKTLEFVAERRECAEEVRWSVRLAPGYEGSAGSILPADLFASYTPQECSDGLPTRKVVVEANACGATASVVVTIQGIDLSVAVQPAQVAVDAGAAGTVDFKALVVTNCPAPTHEWTLEVDDAYRARFTDEQGRTDIGSIERTGAVTLRYRPPKWMRAGVPAPVNLRAKAVCQVQGGTLEAEDTATIDVGLAKALRYEKAYVKGFSSSLFAAGVDLYAGAVLDRDGGKADANAKVPVKVFGAGFNVLDVSNHASVDPRPSGVAHFLHKIDAFGFTVNTMTCPGDEFCTKEIQPWSDSKCIPSGPPPICMGDRYDKPCKKSAECTGGLRCINKLCTKKCDAPDDCPDGVCLGSLAPGPYKKVFVIVIVPVTVEGKICADYGIQASIDLLGSEPHNQFSASFGPFFELGGYASAAVGYSGIFAFGVRGEIVLVRDDFTGKVAAAIDIVEKDADLGTSGEHCPYDAGCILASLRESVENDLQGGKGKVFLFVDYPTLKWCRWYPCIRTARSTKTLASWGSVFEIASTCDWCRSDADCSANPHGGTCVDGTCRDGFPGLLCREQLALVDAK